MKLISVCALLSLLHCLAAQIPSSSSGPSQLPDSEVGLSGFEPDFIDGSPVTPPCEIVPLTDKQNDGRLDGINSTADAQTSATTAAVPTLASTTTATTISTSTTPTTTVLTSTTPTTTVSTSTTPTTTVSTSTTPTTTASTSTTPTTTASTTASTSVSTTTTTPTTTTTTTTVRPVVPNRTNPVQFMVRLLLTSFANALPHRPRPRPFPPRHPHGGPFRRPRFQSDSSEEH